jgi:hypothetical protein
VADQEQLLLSCIQGVAKLLSSERGKGAQSAGVPILADALRESVFFQDFYLNRAAADSIDEAAPLLDAESVRLVAPALVEGLFLQGDFFLYPYARRALVHLAALSPENRDIVIAELLRALGVDMDPEVTAALPDVAALGKNERLDLLRQPCGLALGVSCESAAQSLREFRDKGWKPGRATCNRGRDPDRPGSGFEWGFNYEAIWDKFGTMLVDIVAPLPAGTDPSPGTKVGLALRALQTEVALLDRWIANVKEDQRLHEAISGLYQEFMEPAGRGGEEEEEEGEGEAEERRVPEISNDLEDLFTRFQELRASEATKLSAEARQAAFDLIAELSKEDVDYDDIEACREPFKALFTDVQNDLLALADFDNEYSAVNLKLWRSLAAARTLAMLNVTGANDETLKQILRITQFALDNLMGFRITPLKAFPQFVLRFKQRFNAEGLPMMGTPAIMGLVDAIQNFQRPTPEVMNFLLHMMAASALTGDNSNSTIRQEKYFMMNADVTTFRAMAARAFFTVFRHAESLPNADQYLDLYRFYMGDVQYVLALEKTTDSEAAFQLYPPIVRPAEEGGTYTVDETEGDWFGTLPTRSPHFNFDTYRDVLAQCVLRDKESRSDIAKWRREMNDEQKTKYCKKWVEPFATVYGDEVRGEQVAKLSISDNRCWQHMRAQHEAQIEYCLDIENDRTPRQQLGLGKEQCDDIKDLDNDYLYCGELRFEPQYTEARMPSLWGCYDRFPWFRAREPIGPACDHLAGRALAGYLYVKFRSESGAPAGDGVSYDSLKAAMTLEELMTFARTFGQEQDEKLFQKFDRLVAELARVQLDFPVFVRPSSSEAEARAGVRKPEGAVGPLFVPVPWYWHEDWVAREPRNFGDLRDVFMESCRPEDDDTATECAKDGGKLGNQMKIVIEGGAAGPLQEDAFALAIMLMREDLVGLNEMRLAVEAIEGKCYSGGSYAMSCLAQATLDLDGREKAVFVNPSCRGLVAEALGCVDDPTMPGACEEKRKALAATVCAKYFDQAVQARGLTNAELNRRIRGLYLLAALVDRDRALAEATVADLLIAVDSDVRFLPPVTFALQKIRPQCCPPGQQGACDKLGCERVRAFAEFWGSQPIRDTQVPDIDALYYMLLASR